ncbi:hypothetical protein [Thermofilum sp.]
MGDKIAGPSPEVWLVYVPRKVSMGFGLSSPRDPKHIPFYS